MKKPFKIILVLVLPALFIGLTYVLFATMNGSQGKANNFSSARQVTVYKSPTCGCCVNYVAYLKENGYAVNLVATDDMAGIKATYNIPGNMQSCHTTVIDGYFVEGHVPLPAVDKLLVEKPAIDGISLPAMPAGAPGMPGVKMEPFKIYALDRGQSAEFTTL